MTEKIFIGDSTTATFVCPECERSRTADISKLLTAKAEIKIKCTCKCGHVFPVFIERRKFFRKTLNLSGVIYTSQGDRKYIMTVQDLSRSGCRVKINTSFPFAPEDIVQVEFNLDDKDRSFVSKEAVIRGINGPLLGLEFVEVEKFDKVSQYLMVSS